ncbi:hypothetical protein HPB48_023635 [Haemaphysalis longicornis]|uniref:F-box domain-containing protein n=1 Tax=Haemaphysalis longicornis TaxID=44386 RepID=A0A9J6H7T2_HAELO|nr:hypothetical protein HPB48_023635 [Haemaphysalis longicornis]
MELTELPTELILKIFSYLPQRSLLALAQVSAEIKRMALDPFLWTEVIIDSTLSTCPELWSDVFNSATLMRKLDASGNGVDLEALATASITFERLEELTLTGAMLLNAAMPRLLCRCRSLTSIVLRGESVLTAKGVTVLRELSGLKSLLLSFFIRVPEKVLQEICVSCPALEMLKLSSTSILNDGTWNFLGRLQAPYESVSDSPQHEWNASYSYQLPEPAVPRSMRYVEQERSLRRPGCSRVA